MSTDMTMAEAWNIQLQHKVGRLEREIERLRVAYKLATGRWPEPSPEPPAITEAEVDAFLATAEQT